MTPFVLIGRKKLHSESGPSDDQVYDGNLQVWVDSISGVPLVTQMQADVQSSKFGETTMTKTPEGTDRPDVATIEASKFGETTLTETREGIDQPEVDTIEATQFGETTETRTREGTDQTEATGFQTIDATYTHF